MLPAKLYHDAFTIFYKDPLVYEAMFIAYSITPTTGLLDSFLEVCSDYFCDTLQTRTIQEVELVL